MEQSLTVPTATSVRSMPVKLLEENRRIINEHLGARVYLRQLVTLRSRHSRAS